MQILLQVFQLVILRQTNLSLWHFILSNEIPAINPITNQASVRFQHIVNPANPPVSKNITSNNVTTKIESAILNTIKIGDKTFATIGDTITYTTTITNTGNIPANNVIFSDPLPSWTQLLQDQLLMALHYHPLRLLTVLA